MTIHQSEKEPRLYDTVFFCSYFANVFMLMAISLLFRYSDFVESIGGNEWHLGWIVGIGTTGAVIFRIVQGAAIDRFGAMLVWILSLIGLIVSLLWHIGIHDATSWPVYIARLLFNTCMAGVFGSWLSFVSLRVSEHKVAEVIGVVGSSGFVGMATGPIIGDWIFASSAVLENQVDMMFYVAAGLVGGSLICTLLGGWLDSGSLEAHQQAEKRRARSRIGFRKLLRQYHPGFLLVAAATMGLTIGLPANFLRPFAQTQGIEQIKIFFVTYNIVAFVSRLAFRRAPEVLGLRNAILVGLGLMSISMLGYLAVYSNWAFVIPAIAGGLAHSFLFPSIVAGGTAFFPQENRGTATSIVLAMYDIGVLVGSPLIGLTLTGARQAGLPDYPLMFCWVSLFTLAVGIVFWWTYQPGDGRHLTRRVVDPN